MMTRVITGLRQNFDLSRPALTKRGSYAARLNLLVLVLNLFLMLYCISGSVFTYGVYFRKCKVSGVFRRVVIFFGTTPGLFNKISNALTLSIVTKFYFIPTSRDRTPTNLGRALTYVTGPYITWTGYQ
ncbi:hypothetical protein HanRHA438_Chr07g0321871 [Helianthus annuus]|nr:hypothetical protein HanRHA438_Chr07g0321871 [Helianthus annuus]